ncbi:SNARE associated Golgi protein [Babesia ovis]|uniref:SNARE associated Golgi protein n=1 Tax=Babesia ovis TaxID=5869 RepID=A0A9W5WW71_BABOV|nr:SNARE associated Golgi protein [Babesia ovis]
MDTDSASERVTPPSLFAEDSLKNQRGESVPLSDLAGKSVGLLFCDGSSPICLSTMPFLIQFYNSVNGNGLMQKIEIVYVSCDDSQEAFQRNVRRMPWLHLDYNDRLLAILRNKYNVIDGATDYDHTTNMGGADVYGREQLDDDVVSSARRPLLSGVGSEAEPNPWIARIIILLWLCMTPLAIIYRKEITDFVRYIAMKGADQGPLLYVYYVLIFIFTVSICISAEIMLVSSGFIFSHLHGQIAGIAIGTGLSFIAYFITMLLCFLVSRYLLKGLVYRYLRHYKYYGALIRATEKEGLQLVTMIRLSPFFPPTIVSYIFGSTNVSVRDYCLATFAAIPSLAFFTYIGSLIEDFSNDTNLFSLFFTVQQGDNTLGVLVLAFVQKNVGSIVLDNHEHDHQRNNTEDNGPELGHSPDELVKGGDSIVFNCGIIGTQYTAVDGDEQGVNGTVETTGVTRANLSQEDGNKTRGTDGHTSNHTTQKKYGEAWRSGGKGRSNNVDDVDDHHTLPAAIFGESTDQK